MAVLDWVLLGGGVGLLGGSAFVYARQFVRTLDPIGVPILRYRLVGAPLPGSPLNDLRVPLSRFEAQIRHLRRRGFRPVTLEEALAKRGQRAFLESKPIVLTFDGPYACFLTQAWPVLQRHRMQEVTLFFPANRLGQREVRFSKGRPEPVLQLLDLAKLVEGGVQLGLQATPLESSEREELIQAFQSGRKALRELSGQAIECVSLPFNTPAATLAAREVGFQGAGSLGEGILLRRGGDLLQIPRFPVQPTTSLLEVALVVSRRMGQAEW